MDPFERDARQYERELERIQSRLEILERQERHDHSVSLQRQIDMYKEMGIEMKINIRGMRRRVKEENHEQNKD